MLLLYTDLVGFAVIGELSAALVRELDLELAEADPTTAGSLLTLLTPALLYP